MTPLFDPATGLHPDWPAPAQVQAFVSTRAGGVSSGAYQGLNLGAHVGDDPQKVARNRQLLAQTLGCTPTWLNQTHSCEVVEANAEQVLDADASWSQTPYLAALVMTADCLPVLFCDRAGTKVAAAHAGWRGLAGGILERSVAALATDPHELLAWLGPAIGPASFEVGDEVRSTFVAQHPQALSAFTPGAQAGKWLADLYQLARIRLAACGVTAVYGGGLDTFTDPRFYSYRRANPTGRFASLIWLTDAPDAAHS